MAPCPSRDMRTDPPYRLQVPDSGGACSEAKTLQKMIVVDIE